MPGPVSDSYDPEFGTGNNAAEVRQAAEDQVKRISKMLGSELKNIVEVVQGPTGKIYPIKLTERELRVIRFCMNRAIESI